MYKLFPVKHLSGELKRTEIRKGAGYKLTTKEFVLQREDQSYHILLEDILGMLLHTSDKHPTFTELSAGEGTPGQGVGTPYKIVSTKMKVYNNKGVFDHGATTLYANLSNSFSEMMISFLSKK